MNSKAFIGFTLVILLWATTSYGQTCDSCGKECQSACGTRGFRTCCLNYLKKRGEQPTATEPEIRIPFLKVLSKLAQQHYPLLRNAIIPEEGSTAKLILDKPPLTQSLDKIKCSEYD